MPNEQPEPKPYPIKGQPGLCPLGGYYETGHAGTLIRKLTPCDPENCALGINETKECCIKDAARSINALYLCNYDRTAAHIQLRQLIKELSDRLSAILQSAVHHIQPLPGLEKHFRESLMKDGLAPIERQLGRITEQLERLAPPPKTGEPT